jgi:hypothetical protein
MAQWDAELIYLRRVGANVQDEVTEYTLDGSECWTVKARDTNIIQSGEVRC